VGGPGRDILIGGAGNDVLLGWGKGDILIGGSTAFDANATALDSLMAEWNSAHDYATRVANLSGNTAGPNFANRLNGNCFLTQTGPNATVADDGARDWLFGGRGQNWFLAGANDWTSDPWHRPDHCPHLA
jgi:Ca2+-binding RTX toxin-like protein